MEPSKVRLRQFESQLDDFDPNIRKENLQKLIDLSKNGDVPFPKMKEIAKKIGHQ